LFYKRKTMKSKLPDIGKISPEVFEELIYPRLGAKRSSVIVPPQNGVDVGIVEIGGQAVAMTADSNCSDQDSNKQKGK